MVSREVTQYHEDGVCPRFNEGETTGMMINFFGLHYNPKGWNRPNEFLPERWTDPSIDEDRIPEERVYCPFALGKRSCFGRQFAMIEMITVLARILQKFHIEVAPGCKPKILEGGTLLIEGLSVIFRPIEDMKAATPLSPDTSLNPHPVYTIEEVQQHNKDGDVWMVIGGKVYDFTEFCKGENGGHPGGKSVLVALAGNDGTADWDFIGHSAYATRVRDKYLIGALDMTHETAILRQVLTRERRCLVKSPEGTRSTVKTQIGSWNIDNRVEQKRQEQTTFNISRVKKEREITWAQLAKHNTEADCWITIDGKVYDVSAFMLKHPGGKATLMSVAGGDASVKFDNIHEAGIIEQYSPELYVGIIKPGSEQLSGLKPGTKKSVVATAASANVHKVSIPGVSRAASWRRPGKL